MSTKFQLKWLDTGAYTLGRLLVADGFGGVVISSITAHDHTNKSLLDSYNQSNEDLSNAVSRSHVQNSDLGTDNSTFALDMDADIPILIKNNAGVLELLNEYEDAFKDIKCNDVVLDGTDADIRLSVDNGTNRLKVTNEALSSYVSVQAGGFYGPTGTAVSYEGHVHTGTTNQTYALDSDATTPLLLKNSSGVLEIRSNADDAYLSAKFLSLTLTDDFAHQGDAIGFFNGTPTAKTTVTLTNTDGAIGDLTIGAAYNQTEIQNLRNACETLADDLRNIKAALSSYGLI